MGSLSFPIRNNNTRIAPLKDRRTGVAAQRRSVGFFTSPLQTSTSVLTRGSPIGERFNSNVRTSPIRARRPHTARMIHTETIKTTSTTNHSRATRSPQDKPSSLDVIVEREIKYASLLGVPSVCATRIPSTRNTPSQLKLKALDKKKTEHCLRVRQHQQWSLMTIRSTISTIHTSV